MTIEAMVHDEQARRAAFPIAAHQAFFGHAGVCPLPAAAQAALQRYADEAGQQLQESPWANEEIKAAKRLAAALIGGDEQEIALLGPTSLGLNLVAHGLDWRADDEVVYYADDYPANVYCWAALAERGVVPKPIQTSDLAGLGVITWEAIEPHLTERTRLVSLASCNFLSGYRIDVDTIGRRLHERGILFCLDAIQTLGAQPLSVEHVDFLAADAHKWLLGPCGAGLFYVARAHQDRLRPALLGSWNVRSPHFIAQPEIELQPGARRYEPGTFNVPGIVGMAASLRLLLELGVESIGRRLAELHGLVLAKMIPLGFERYLPEMPDAARSGIVTLRHRSADMKRLFEALNSEGIAASLRHDRAGTPLLRFSPHVYNTAAEIERAAKCLGRSI